MAVSIAALAGLVWGSFANVLIARIPQGRPWVAEPSRCPRCEQSIAWYDNLPLVSFALLRGRCRHCKERISARYPLVELAVTLTFVGVYGVWGMTITALAFAYLALISVVLVVIDIDVQRLPDAIVKPSYVIAIVLLSAAVWASGEAWDLARMGIGMAALGGFYGAMWLIYPAGLGFGDVKTAGLLGLYGGFLGWPQLALAGFAGPMLGGLLVLGGLLTGKLTRKSAVPYGPALIAGAWVGYLWGEQVIDAYMKLVIG